MYGSKPKPSTLVLIIFLATAFGVFYVALEASSSTFICLSTPNSNMHVIIPVEQETTVLLQYTHSVSRLRVVELYQVDGDTMVLKTVVMGDGRDVEHSYSGMVFMDGGNVLIEDVERRVEKIRLRVGGIGRPSITVGDKSLDLTSFPGVGEAVIIRVGSCEKMSFNS